ncbi:retrovirus-related pol polyprotein from transposon TNT 1-94 [Tanacetum coccineum]
MQTRLLMTRTIVLLRLSRINKISAIYSNKVVSEPGYDKQWHKMALGVVRLSLAKNVAYNVVNEKTTYDLFKALSNMYEKPSALNKMFLIPKLVNTKMKAGASVADHVNEFNPILSRLMSVDIKFNDEVQALLLLSLLPESWSGTVTTVSGSTKTTKLKFDNIHDLILREDIRRNTSGEYSNSLLSAEDKGKGRKQDKGQKQNRGRLKSKKRGQSKNRLRSSKVRLADDKTLDTAGVGDVVLKTSFGTTWTLKDVRITFMSKKVVEVDADLAQFKVIVAANQEANKQFAEETRQRLDVMKEAIDMNKSPTTAVVPPPPTRGFFTQTSPNTGFATQPLLTGGYTTYAPPSSGIVIPTAPLVNPTAPPSAAYTSFSGLRFDWQGFLIPLWETYGNYNQIPPVSNEGSFQNFSDVSGGKRLSFTKVEIPLFDGNDVLGWVYQAESLFDVQKVNASGERLRMMVLCLEGTTLAWTIVRTQQPNGVTEAIQLTLLIDETRAPFKRMRDSKFVDKKTKGICYHCDGKFGLGHQCPEKALQILLPDDEEEEEKEGGMTRNTILEDKLDEEGYHVGFRDQQLKVTKGSLVVARGNKRGSLYMVEVPSDGINATIDGRSNVGLWHQRLGHMSEKGIKILASKGRIPDLQKAVVGVCEPCVLGKQKKATVDNETTLRVKCLKSDNGREYSSREFIEYCAENEIWMLKTVPKIPQQNGVAERINQTFNEREKRFRILEEEWQGKEVSLVHLRIFGCDSYVQVKDVARDKLNAKSMKNKVRLVTQGYNQQEGIDFDETYAPVARLESIRILLAYACAHDFKLFQMDVKSAFLNGFINEEVYVSQPPGFVDFEKPNHVFKLKKAIYGLKQAPEAWYDRLKAFLLDHKYTIGLVDNTLFTKKKDSHIIIVQIYVDDIILGSTCQDLCDDFSKIMHDEFEMSMMSELNFFLGFQIKQLEDGIFFNQSKYIKEVLKKFGLKDFKPIKTHMSSETKLTRDKNGKSVDKTKYHGMIGSLLNLTASRLDIMFSDYGIPKERGLKSSFTPTLTMRETMSIARVQAVCAHSWDVVSHRGSPRSKQPYLFPPPKLSTYLLKKLAN